MKGKLLTLVAFLGLVCATGANCQGLAQGRGPLLGKQITGVNAPGPIVLPAGTYNLNVTFEHTSDRTVVRHSLDEPGDLHCNRLGASYGLARSKTGGPMILASQEDEHDKSEL
jgi:hypothetical protein